MAVWNRGSWAAGELVWARATVAGSAKAAAVHGHVTISIWILRGASCRRGRLGRRLRERQQISRWRGELAGASKSARGAVGLRTSLPGELLPQRASRRAVEQRNIVGRAWPTRPLPRCKGRPVATLPARVRIAMVAQTVQAVGIVARGRNACSVLQGASIGGRRRRDRPIDGGRGRGQRPRGGVGEHHARRQAPLIVTNHGHSKHARARGGSGFIGDESRRAVEAGRGAADVDMHALGRVGHRIARRARSRRRAR